IESAARQVELQTLRGPELLAYLQRERWIPMSYSAWADLQAERRPARTTPAVSADVHDICQSLEVSAPPWVSAAQPDSRAFAEVAVAQTSPGERVLDLGTGTGILGICMAKAGRSVVAADRSQAA